MQIRTYNEDGTLAGGGTVSVTNDSNIVYAQAGVDWSQALQGSQFTVVGSGVTYDVAAPPVLVGSTWHILISANYAGPTNAAAAYVIQKDFGDFGEPIFAIGDTEILTLLNRWTRSIAGAVAGVSRPVIVNTIADLQAVLPLPGLSVFVLGRNVVGDGGGGLFVYSNGAEQTDGGTVFPYNGDISAPATAARTPSNLNGYTVAAGNLAFSSVSFALSNGIVIPDLLLHGHRMNSDGILTVPRINHKTGLVTDTNDAIKTVAIAAGVSTITIGYKTIGNTRRWVRPAFEVLSFPWFYGKPATDAAGDGGNLLSWAMNAAKRLGVKTIDLAGNVVRYYNPIEQPDGLTLRNGVLKVIDGAGANNVLKYIRADYVPGPDAYLQLDMGPGIFPQDNATFIAQKKIELDGNFLTNDDCMVNRANYPGGGGPDNLLQNSATYVGLSLGNQGGRTLPNLKVTLEDWHAHHFGSCDLLGSEDVWISGTNVRLGPVMRNHHFYTASGIFTNLEVYGHCWGASLKIRQNVFNGLRIVDLIDNPYNPTDTPTLFNLNGLDYDDGSPVSAGRERAAGGCSIVGLFIDLCSITRMQPIFTGIIDGLSVQNASILGSKAASAKLIDRSAGGTGMCSGWAFENVDLYQRGYEWSLGFTHPIYATSFTVRNVEIKNARSYNNPVASNPTPLLMPIVAAVRTDPASALPQNIEFVKFLRRNLAATNSAYCFDFDVLNAGAGKIKVRVKDSEVASPNETIIKAPNGSGHASGLTINDPSKLEILWENSIIPDNGANAAGWTNLELYIRCSRFRNCTTPQGYKTEDSGSIAFTSAAETVYDIQTALLWVPKSTTNILLCAKNAVTAAALNAAWVTFRHRSAATDIAWGTFVDGNPAGDYRNCKIRLNFASALGTGQAIAFDWFAAVAP